MIKNKYIFIILIFISMGVFYVNHRIYRGKDILSIDGMNIANTVYSPDRKNKAVLFSNTEGNIMKSNIRIAIVPSYRDNAYDSDVKFILYRAWEQSISMKFKNNKKILIKYSNLKEDIIRADKKAGGVNIIYKQEMCNYKKVN